MINQSIKFFTIFLLAFSVFAGGDDRDEEYYETLDAELASFEAQLAETLLIKQLLKHSNKNLLMKKLLLLHLLQHTSLSLNTMLRLQNLWMLCRERWKLKLFKPN